MKQVILIRADIRMSTGKKVAQGCHASVGAALSADSRTLGAWSAAGSKKIALRVSGERAMRELHYAAKKMRLPCFLVSDAGLTEIEAGTITALAIGPAEDKKIDKLTGSLKLL